MSRGNCRASILIKPCDQYQTLTSTATHDISGFRFPISGQQGDGDSKDQRYNGELRLQTLNKDGLERIEDTGTILSFY